MHFPEWIFFIQISLKFIPNDTNNNSLALVQKLAWRRIGDKPLSELLIGYLIFIRWQTIPRTNAYTFLHGTLKVEIKRYENNFKTFMEVYRCEIMHCISKIMAIII